MSKPFLDVLSRSRCSPPPVWLMRQAGRYLPEYREVRERAGSFLDLVFTPDLAAEVTLQPIRRFGFNAAILFSDILVIPHALGQSVTFTAGEGPRLDPIVDRDGLKRLNTQVDSTVLVPIYQTIRIVKENLSPNITLLGFCGAPWTVATYMIAGRGTPDQEPARVFAYKDPEGFSELIDRLVTVSVDYLTGQFAAGADAVQIFDTWAGILPPEQFARWSIAPTRRIVEELRRRVPGAKVIGFPRGAGTNLRRYVDEVAVDAVGLDWMVDLAYARERIQSRIPVQGNLDPYALIAGGGALDRAVDAILETLGGGPLIFNLGHGILPHTPIAHVERMLARVRGRPA